MFLISGRNVDECYQMAGTLVRGVAQPASSRYGDVLEMPRPVTTHYHFPTERVLFDPVRDANPFFHLMESLWILAGRSDVAWLKQFNARMAEFSDNGVTFHAPYGHRLRMWPDPQARVSGAPGYIDQLLRAVEMLKANPRNRRVVLSIWDPVRDLNTDSKDIPCNDTIKLEADVAGRLNMIVFCRSNDMIWGAYGANVVQFSMIQEAVAGLAGLEVGWYEQVSANFHAYTGEWEKRAPWKAHWEGPYHRGECSPYPLVGDPDTFLRDLDRFMEWTRHPEYRVDTYNNGFFAEVAEPMFMAWDFHKVQGRTDLALTHIRDEMAECDWSLAAWEWLSRRQPRADGRKARKDARTPPKGVPL